MDKTWLTLLQLDDRYFQGLTGQYDFKLQYRLHKDGEAEYIARSKPSYFMYRSVTTELDLEAGQYSVLIKITASRKKWRTKPEEIVKRACQVRPEKLMAVGLSYDLAHAKGRLNESELEHKERLRRDRRIKRKLKAKEAFAAQKLLDKKKKLRRLRLEAKEKPRKGKEPESNQDNDKGIEISIKVGESTLKPTKPQGADKGVDGSRTVSQEGTSKQLKIIVEASDKIEGAKSSDQTTSGELKQPAEGGDKPAEDAKQALQGPKDESKNTHGKGEDTDVKGVPVTEGGQESGKESSTSTFGATPATSAESISAAEDGNKAEGQPSAALDNNAVASKKITSTTATIETGENAQKPNAVASDMHFQNLTLDDISDDGLSWSSDIDVPSDSTSETDSDSDIDEPVPAPTDPSQSSDMPTDDFANDPWNAVCVFGLRVYSKGSQAEIEVVRKLDDGESAESKKLDMDDQAADATKKLQKGSAREEKQLENVSTAPGWDEESKQG